MKLFFPACLLLFICINYSCKNQNPPTNPIKKYTLLEQEEISDSLVKHFRAYGINSKRYRDSIDSAIKKFPSFAYLYQQRAMPLYKQDKDELGLPFLNKAATLNPKKYLDYAGFMKCIFSKNYNDAILDFKTYLDKFGEGYVMDHTYYFYIGISHLQLNQFEKAKENLEKSIKQTQADGGDGWVHYLDLLYLGIATMELGDYENAILHFNKALAAYDRFSDAKFYKGRCLYLLGNSEKAKQYILEAKEDLLNGFTINEDNVIYERYPYQLRKAWFGI